VCPPLHFLQWWKARSRRSFDGNVCNMAAFGGQIATLQWLRDNVDDRHWNTNLFACAAAGGDVRMLMWLDAHDCPIDTTSYHAAATHHRLDALMWLTRYDSQRSLDLTRIVQYVVRWHEIYPIFASTLYSRQAYKVYARDVFDPPSNVVDMLELLHGMGYKPDGSVMSMILASRNLTTDERIAALQWVSSHGIGLRDIDSEDRYRVIAQMMRGYSHRKHDGSWLRVWRWLVAQGACTPSLSTIVDMAFERDFPAIIDITHVVDYSRYSDIVDWMLQKRWWFTKINMIEWMYTRTSCDQRMWNSLVAVLGKRGCFGKRWLRMHPELLRRNPSRAARPRDSNARKDV
jgi:hypothetical protein